MKTRIKEDLVQVADLKPGDRWLHRNFAGEGARGWKTACVHADAGEPGYLLGGEWYAYDQKLHIELGVIRLTEERVPGFVLEARLWGHWYRVCEGARYGYILAASNDCTPLAPRATREEWYETIGRLVDAGCLDYQFRITEV